MLSEQQKTYHLDRARVEMDMAYRATARSAAAAHMKLSSLHIGRIKELDDACDGSAVRRPR